MPKKLREIFGISTSIGLNSSDSWIWLRTFKTVANVTQISSNSPCDQDIAEVHAYVNMLCSIDVRATGAFSHLCNNQED